MWVKKRLKRYEKNEWPYNMSASDISFFNFKELALEKSELSTMNLQQTKSRQRDFYKFCDNWVLDIGYKNLLANTDPDFYSEWFPEEKDKLDASTLRPKPTWALSGVNSGLVSD